MLGRWNWVPHVFAIEIKKAINYRVAFWFQFITGTTADLAVSYCLWGAIFTLRGVESLEGFSFHGIIYYYLFASFAFKISRGADWGYVSEEIYNGTLTRYLLYPVPFLGYKYITHITQQILAIVQLLLAFGALRLCIGTPADLHVTFSSLLLGILTCFIAGYLHFMISTSLEMISFWQDVIWNVIVMLRFITTLLGGALIPLAFFPEWARKICEVTPFAAIIAFPARVFMGDFTAASWWGNTGLIVVWSIAFTLLASWIWSRGTRQFTGVGI